VCPIVAGEFGRIRLDLPPAIPALGGTNAKTSPIYRIALAAKTSQLHQKRKPPEPAAAPVFEREDGYLKREVEMDERQKLQSDLKRYWTIRDLISDERVVAVIEELIRETEKRLSQIEASSPEGSIAELRPDYRSRT